MSTYEINIAHQIDTYAHMVHYALVKLDTNDRERAERKFRAFCNRFPASEGFSLTLREVPGRSYTIIAYSEVA